MHKISQLELFFASMPEDNEKCNFFKAKIYTALFVFMLFSSGVFASEDDFITFELFQPNAVERSAGMLQPTIEEYWTPERMAAAQPIEISLEGAPVDRFTQDLQPSGPIILVPNSWSATEPSLPWLGFPTEDQSAQGSPFYYPFAYTKHDVAQRLYTAVPYRAVGRVFFTQDGVDRVCSGASLANFSHHRYEAKVITAGHCVSDGNGNLVTNWVFVPAYRPWLTGDDQRPYGTWSASRYTLFVDWHRLRVLARDVAVVTVNSDSEGKRLYERVGGFGWVVNLPRRPQHYYSLGYPRLTNRMTQSAGAWALDDASKGHPPTIGMGGGQGGGSSGGPWVRGFMPGWYSSNQRAMNVVNGVVSYGYEAYPRAHFSPYFDTAVHQMIIN